MRLSIFLLIACSVLCVLIEAKPSSSSSSSSNSGGKVHSGGGGKTRARHHSSASSESDEEHRNRRQKKLALGRLRKYHSGEEAFSDEDKERRHRTDNMLRSPHNATRHFRGKHVTGNKNVTLIKNVNATQMLNVNNTKLATLYNITEKIPRESQKNLTHSVFNSSQLNLLNDRKNETLLQFIRNEKGSDILPKNNSFSPFELKNNSTVTAQHGSINNSSAPPPYGWKNKSGTPPQYGWKTNSDSPPSHGWIKSSLGHPPSQTDPSNSSAPVDLRKYFAIPDRAANQGYYFSYPNIGSSYSSSQNLISDHTPPAHNLPYPDFNLKTISNIGPEYGWGVQNPLLYYNSAYPSPDGRSYPIENSHENSNKDSSKHFEGPAKAAKGIFKAVGKGLTGDSVKDAIKQAASSYFSNPPPSGWVYNPPYQNTKQTYYGNYIGPFLQPNSREKLSVEDWRSIIFGHVPMKVDTQQLYSAAFPETSQNFNLSPLSEKGGLPDFTKKSYRVSFPAPYYPKIFAGLQNDEMNQLYRTKRELSPKGKALADSINKFLNNERNCNDTDLDARRKKRQLVIRPIVKNTQERRKEDEGRISNFPFSRVEAIVQSDYDVSVFGGIPEELPPDNSNMKNGSLTETDRKYEFNQSHEKTENVIHKVSSESTSEVSGREISSTAAYSAIVPVLSEPSNRTKLHPVSETIEQFLRRKPKTKLTAVGEPMDQWKARAAKVSSNGSMVQEPLHEKEGRMNFWKRLTRSDEESNEGDVAPVNNRFHRYRTLLGSVASDYSSTSQGLGDLYSSSRYVSRGNQDKLERINVPTLQDGDSSIDRNSIELETDGGLTITSPRTISIITRPNSSKNKGLYFFGVYINDYENPERLYHGTSNSEKTKAGGSGVFWSNPQGEISSENLSSYDSSMLAFSQEEPVLYGSSQGSFENSEENDWQYPTGSGTSFSPSTEPTRLVKKNDPKNEYDFINRWQTTSSPTISNPAEDLEEPAGTGSAGEGRNFFDLFTTSGPEYSLTSWPFRINNILSYSSGSPHASKKRPNEMAGDSVRQGTLIIKVPLKKIVCGDNERYLNGKCRKIW